MMNLGDCVTFSYLTSLLCLMYCFLDMTSIRRLFSKLEQRWSYVLILCMRTINGWTKKTTERESDTIKVSLKDVKSETRK